MPKYIKYFYQFVKECDQTFEYGFRTQIHKLLKYINYGKYLKSTIEITFDHLNYVFKQNVISVLQLEV